MTKSNAFIIRLVIGIIFAFILLKLFFKVVKLIFFIPLVIFLVGGAYYLGSTRKK
ncbi:MAG: hypothetical protein HQK76_07435 [Desulfobacterales bacterium]|nr:hypothetical protein [Desulfobacterales bacterium]